MLHAEKTAIPFHVDILNRSGILNVRIINDRLLKDEKKVSNDPVVLDTLDGRPMAASTDLYAMIFYQRR